MNISNSLSTHQLVHLAIGIYRVNHDQHPGILKSVVPSGALTMFDPSRNRKTNIDESL